ncbi:hypothetical protein QYF36_005166 [Acer negundo]|nr:hypothetical protein QYF36_005166 [Acer negundo]
MPSRLNWAKPSFVPALGVDKNLERGYESQNKRRKKEELMGSNQSNAVGSDINLKKTAYEVGTHSSDDAAKFGGSKQTFNVKVEEVAANNRKNEDQKKSSENEGGSKKRVVVKEGVSKDTRNVMAEEAAAIKEGGSKKMSSAKSGGFERTTVQPRVGMSKLVQPRNPFFGVGLRTKAKKLLLLVPSRFLKDHMLDLSGPVLF